MSDGLLQISKQDEMYKRLKSMRVGTIHKEAEWEDCCNCSCTEYEKNKFAIFQNLAGYLVSKNKIPLEIVKFKDTIFVRTEKQNA